MANSSTCSPGETLRTSSSQLLPNNRKTTMTMSLFFKQINIMLWKSFIVRRVHYLSTFFELFGPILLIWAFVAINSSTSGTRTFSSERNLNKFQPPTFFNQSYMIKMNDVFPENTIFYYPNDAKHQNLVESLNRSGIAVRGFDSEKSMIKALKEKSRWHKIYQYDSNNFGIVFKNVDSNNKKLEYQIYIICLDHFVSNFRPFPMKNDQGPVQFSFNENYNIWIAILSLHLFNGFSSQNISEINLNRMPYPKYAKFDEPLIPTYDLLSNFILVSYVLIVPLIVKRITDEKASHSKELLKMMGMSNGVYWISHFINYLIILVFHSFVFTYLLFWYSHPLFVYSSWFLVFLFLVLFSVQTILFSMLLTTVFHRPVIAVITTIVIWLACSILIYQRLSPTKAGNLAMFGSAGVAARAATSLLPMGSLIWFMSLVGHFELTQTGVNFESMFHLETIPFGDFKVYHIFLLVIASFPIYIFLIWYLDNVWPWQNGVPRQPWFIFMPSFWCPKENTEHKPRPKMNEKTFEPEPIGLHPAIELIDVTKVFSSWSSAKKVAVDHLWLNIYKNQLTVLLGHNGAGKSTTMNMITGMFPATSGEIFLNGYNVFIQTDEARRSIGLCPQENIVFGELTVAQHLKLFAYLKDYPTDQVNQEVKRVLDLLKLSEKSNSLATNLSGGMKRKLQLGLALVGDTDILILDEPTSGLDPEARRNIWDLLIQLRRHKTILLTTHYMEEADVLGDRLAIMSQGKLQCSGSPAFLKNVFGTGYQLRVEKMPSFRHDAFLELLQKYVPTAQMKSEIETEIIYNFDEQRSNNKQELIKAFPSLLKEIESNRENYGVISFGLSYSTLEDVFLAVESIPGIESDKNVEEQSVEALLPVSRIQLTSQSELLTGEELIATQYYALVIKRFHYARRHWQMIILQLLVPALILMLALWVSNSILSVGRNINHVDPIEYNVEKNYGPNAKVFYQGSEKLMKNYQEVNQRYQADVKEVPPKKEFAHYIISDENTLDLSKYIKKVSYGLEHNQTMLGAWFNAEQTYSIPLSLKALFESYLRSVGNSEGSFDISLQPIVMKSEETSKTELAFLSIILTWIVMCLILIPIAFPFLGSSYILYPIQERFSKAKLIQMMTGVRPWVFWLSNFFFDFVYHCIAITIIFFIIFLFDEHKIIFDPHTASAASLYALMVGFGFATIPFAYLFSYLFDNSSSGFVVMVILFIVFGLIGNIFLGAADFITHFSRSDILAWALNLLPIFRLVPIFSMVYGYQKIYKASGFSKMCKDIPDLNATCHSMAGGLNPLTVGCCPNLCSVDRSCYDAGSLSFDIYGSGWEFLFLLLTGIIYLLAVILCESYKQQLQLLWSGLFGCGPWKKSNGTSSIGVQSSMVLEDSDVTDERERVTSLLTGDSIRRYQHDYLLVHDLSKNFGPLTAVDHLTFGVHYEECFGLLGVNGAGKTTTFSMLTGDLFPDAGDAFLNGDYSVISHLKEFQKNIGYCPQFDALLENLTGEECLYMMARLRGVPQKFLSRDVSQLIQMTDLEPHAKKLTMKYSGGNKRKLSIALALIGNPPLLFLDEPTCGVDPSARRKIWQTLSLIKKNFNSSMVLTSHSMEECEALCSRIAIMVSGKFRCLGSTQHLRTKYGQGYTILIRLKRQHESDEGYVEQVQTKLMKRLPSATLKDSHQCLLTYHVTDTSVKWSELFEIMAELDSELAFEDYIISDTTLESIFITFAKAQLQLKTKID